MKYYRFNQIAMAVLGALLLFFGAKTIIQIAQEEHEPEKPGFEVAGTEDTKKGGGEAKPGGGGELATLLAGADVARGAEVAKKCAICHTVDKGGANLIGPNLYGVLGRKIASHEGYEYSEALKAKEGNWDYAQLDQMTANPSVFAPGTKMALFPGLPDAKQRADVIVFLRSKNDNPPPLPEAVAAPAAEKPAAETPAGGQPAGGSEVIAHLATADPKQGETDAALCKVCHTFDKGGAVLVGPNLYGVVGKKIASQEGVNYTPALKSKQGDWTYENLDLWLANPQAFAPGTTMIFPGVPDVKKRANIIAFLRSKSDSPAPLPAAAGEAAQPTDKAAETPAAPAEAAPPAAGHTRRQSPRLRQRRRPRLRPRHLPLRKRRRQSPRRRQRRTPRLRPRHLPLGKHRRQSPRRRQRRRPRLRPRHHPLRKRRRQSPRRRQHRRPHLRPRHLPLRKRRRQSPRLRQRRRPRLRPRRLPLRKRRRQGPTRPQRRTRRLRPRRLPLPKGSPPLRSPRWARDRRHRSRSRSIPKGRRKASNRPLPKRTEMVGTRSPEGT